MNISGHWLVLFFGACTAALGGWTMYHEAASNFRGGTTAISRIARIADASAPAGVTILTQRDLLLDCEQVLRSDNAIEMQYQPVAVRTQLPVLCGTIADNLSRRDPANAFAWFVGARASQHAGDIAGYQQRLERSLIAAPNELWLARMRYDSVEDGVEQLTPESESLYVNDLANLASNPDAIWTLAKRYVDYKPFRGRMELALTAMAPADQQKFLDTVGSLLSRAGR